MDQLNVDSVVWASAKRDIFWPGQVSLKICKFLVCLFRYIYRPVTRKESSIQSSHMTQSTAARRFIITIPCPKFCELILKREANKNWQKVSFEHHINLASRRQQIEVANYKLTCMNEVGISLLSLGSFVYERITYVWVIFWKSKLETNSKNKEEICYTCVILICRHF